jgi:MalT-like TPR region
VSCDTIEPLPKMSLRERDQLVLARVLLAEQTPQRALGLLGRLHALAATQGRVSSVLEVLALRALALRAVGDEQVRWLSWQRR